MDDHTFAALLGQVGALSVSQREALLRVLSSPALAPGALLDNREADLVRCPHCDGAQVSKWGTAQFQCADRNVIGTATSQIGLAWLCRGVAADAECAQVGEGLPVVSLVVV